MCDEDRKLSKSILQGMRHIVANAPKKNTRLRPEVYCQDCNWQGQVEECEEVKNLTQRVAPGEPMPVGECPKCGALCQLITE